MANTKMYTNGQKVTYFKEKIQKLQEYVAALEQLPPDEYTSQNWKSELQRELDQKRMEQYVTAAIQAALKKA